MSSCSSQAQESHIKKAWEMPGKILLKYNFINCCAQRLRPRDQNLISNTRCCKAAGKYYLNTRSGFYLLPQTIWQSSESTGLGARQRLAATIGLRNEWKRQWRWRRQCNWRSNSCDNQLHKWWRRWRWRPKQNEHSHRSGTRWWHWQWQWPRQR